MPPSTGAGAGAAVPPWTGAGAGAAVPPWTGAGVGAAVPPWTGAGAGAVVPPSAVAVAGAGAAAPHSTGAAAAPPPRDLGRVCIKSQIHDCGLLTFSYLRVKCFAGSPADSDKDLYTAHRVAAACRRPSRPSRRG